jgi:hypothetical protein
VDDRNNQRNDQDRYFNRDGRMVLIIVCRRILLQVMSIFFMLYEFTYTYADQLMLCRCSSAGSPLRVLSDCLRLSRL